MVQATIGAGHLVAGRYLLECEIGRGGMATVFRARDHQLERDVAVKLIDRSIASSGSVATRPLDEARAAAGIQAPNILTVFDSGDDGGHPFIVMELVEGGDLAGRLERDGRLVADEAVRLGYGIASGLAALHARGLVHCDLKPSNVLLTRDGQPKLADFGISRLASAAEGTTSTVVGSAAYLSPEQVRGEAIGPQTDMYALGVILYELLTGQRPFTGTSLAEVAVRRLQGRPRPVSELANDLPPGLVAVLDRLLALDPAHRYVDGTAAAAALAQFVNLMGLSGAGPYAPTAKIARAGHRRMASSLGRVLGWVLLAFLVLLGLLMIGMGHTASPATGVRSAPTIAATPGPALIATAAPTAPIAEPSVAAPERPASAPERPALAPERPAPTAERAAPTPERPAPTPERPAPTPERPAPTPERPAPDGPAPAGGGEVAPARVVPPSAPGPPIRDELPSGNPEKPGRSDEKREKADKSKGRGH